METPLSPHLSISLAIAMLAAVGLIAYVLARLLPRAVASLSRRQQLAGVNRTDNPYENILTKAELLLTYAADNGIEVGEPERRAIYNFRLTEKKNQNADIVDALYLAYMKLSKAVTPRTAESITETSLERNRGVQKYRKIAVSLSLFVIPFSVLSFVSSAISTKIGQEIDDGNSLILQLRDGLGPNFAQNKEKLNNSDIIMKTQQLSTTMRAIHETGNEIGFTLFGLMPPTPPSPTVIPAGLPNVAETITKMIPEFQDLRQYGQTGRDLVAVIYGALSTCILPGRHGRERSAPSAWSPDGLGSSGLRCCRRMRSAIRAISVYTRSRAPEEFGPVAAASDARSSRVSGIPAGSAAASSPRRSATASSGSILIATRRCRTMSQTATSARSEHRRRPACASTPPNACAAVSARASRRSKSLAIKAVRLARQ